MFNFNCTSNISQSLLIDVNAYVTEMFEVMIFSSNIEMLLRLFIIFYNLEIIEEDIFLKWKEDINDSYQGKGKALFQVKLMRC